MPGCSAPGQAHPGSEFGGRPGFWTAIAGSPPVGGSVPCLMQLVDNETVLGHSSGQAALTDEVCHVLPLLNEAWWTLLGAATA